MKRQPKRIRVWVNEYGSSVGFAHSSRRAARANRTPRATRIEAVPLIEIRRGEVVVDVEALVREVEMLDWTSDLFGDPSKTLRAALRKVGVR